MPVLRAGGAELVAGRSGAGGQVRWVHATELADVAPLLRSGDLVLTTGIALPGSRSGLDEFVASLVARGVAGLVVELGRRWTAVPHPLVLACESRGLPLIVLARETSFAAVTQSVGERIVEEQLEELREAQRVHDTFTELSIAEAGPAQILDAVQQLSAAAVVLEDEQHRVVDYRSGSADIAGFLANWQARSRAVETTSRTLWHEADGWLVTRLGRRDRGWGRLVLQVPGPPPQRLIAMIERAAAALAMYRLHDQNRSGLVRRTHHELLLAVLTDPDAPDLPQRCELLGLPVTGRVFVGVAVRPVLPMDRPGGPPSSLADDVIAALVRAAHESAVPALVATVEGEIRALLSIAADADARAIVDELAERVARRQPVVFGVGRTVTRIDLADRTLKESRHVAESVPQEAADRLVHRIDDVHVRGLLTVLGDDERLSLFVDRELRPLREYDQRYAGDLMAALRALLRYPGNKSEAAASLSMSRPAFYDRLAKIAALLRVDLDDPDIRVSLHLAVIADEMLHRP
ncbi:PucR family transcriptional regulator [Nocardia aurantia]|uniref:Purine catabolism regulatory protein n=1 Tax=Nocardia aurantia TaxID=2585199 RepID=A0A7K0DV62_9NOCA|nr:PucR family transcriptional regulator ligand-binding domain-containing protein [Nocardia aurantia]MQY28714.1 Purine catabolism regulatory protein [Nocardia aurantia]